VPFFIPAPKTYTLIFLVIAVLALFAGSSQANAISDVVKNESVANGWFYHWGDLPKNLQSGQWDFDGSDWQPNASPSAIPGRQNENIVWLKVKLPSKSWYNPHLFMSSVDLTLQIFLANKQIYQFGEFDGAGNSHFEGWPWHIVRLPADYSQHTLYFRIFSDYSDIGLSGDVIIGERFELLSDVYQRGFTGLLFILVLVVVGIISTIMGAIKKDAYVAISTGLLSFDLALMMFAENELSQLVLFDPLSWRYIAAASYFLIPAFLAIVMRSWDKTTSTISGWVLVVSIIFVASVALLSAFGSFNFVYAYPYFDLMFIVLVLSLMVSCFRKVPKLGLRGLFMAFGILALFVSLMLDMMSAHGLIDWIGRMGQWGLIVFALTSLSIYLLQDWQQQKDLNALTMHLEAEVEARTQELRASQKDLEKLAREDFLTSLLNRRAFSEQAVTDVAGAIREQSPLSLMLFDIDHFKDINDTYGHGIGDLVLKAIAAATRETCRESDLICRYGGEEFVLLLHATDSQQAQKLAARLRQAINDIEVRSSKDEVITVSASFGLIYLENFNTVKEPARQLLERLLCAADQVMYEVKTSGRDGIRMHELIEAESPRQLERI